VQGTLKDRPLPRLLQQLYRKQFTGHFVVSDETHDESEVYLRDGSPVHVRRPVDTDRLDNLLIEYGVVPADVVAAASAQVTDGLRLGAVLERMGALDKQKLAQVLKSQVVRKLTRLFFVTEGSYAVYVAPHNFGLGEELGLMRVDPRSVIYPGIRAAYDLPRVTQELTRLLGQRFKLTDISTGFLVGMGIPPEDPTVEALRHDFMTLDDLDHVTSRPLEVRSVALALYYADLLDREPVSQPHSDSPVPRAVNLAQSSDIYPIFHATSDAEPTVPVLMEPLMTTPAQGTPVVQRESIEPGSGPFSTKLGQPVARPTVASPVPATAARSPLITTSPPPAPVKSPVPATTLRQSGTFPPVPEGVRSPVPATTLRRSGTFPPVPEGARSPDPTAASRQSGTFPPVPEGVRSPVPATTLRQSGSFPPAQEGAKPSSSASSSSASMGSHRPSGIFPAAPVVSSPASAPFVATGKPAAPIGGPPTPVVRAPFVSAVRAESKPTAASPGKAPAGGTSPAMTAEGLRTSVQEMSQKLGKLTHFELLGVSQGASSDEVGTAFVRAARQFHPDRLASQGLSDLQPLAERILARINEAAMVLGDAKRRADYVASLASDAPAMQTSLPTVLEAENTFLRGEVYLKKGDFGKAIEAFTAACQGNPNEPQYRAYLAWARFEDPHTRKESVVRETLKVMDNVVKERPMFARGFFWIGLMWKFLNENDKAEPAFREAVHIDNALIEASRELRLIEMRRNKAGGSKPGHKPEAPKGGLMGKFFKK
jgi:DnaJ domain/Domain of unknown function (DUF4388)